ncbi:hypothetical protein ACQCSX_04505 [Pseudarthrobacter sp. P1]|uniref:hypothetical protein n=1 Tax=Pseudarthrobacter sp. P1 TaxID=3418418 RepID=UPI003CF7CFB1
MSYDKAAMARFADYAIANCNGRLVDLAGRTLNVDGRYGYQCMDLWIWIRYRLGFTDNLPTPDAASVWELNSQPGLNLWNYWDAITPDQSTYPGDIGIMNRAFFGNGVGHIFMIVADLGANIRVLELNGLGDGFEDTSGGQHGSPARIHDWPKTYLYGYLRWIGPAPTISGQSNAIDPIQEDDMTPEDRAKLETTLGKVQTIIGMLDNIAGAVNETPGKTLAKAVPRAGGTGDTSLGLFLSYADADRAATVSSIKTALAALPAKDIASAIPSGIAQQVADELAKRMAS